MKIQLNESYIALKHLKNVRYSPSYGVFVNVYTRGLLRAQDDLKSFLEEKI